jgi:phosphoserine phosphatase
MLQIVLIRPGSTDYDVQDRIQGTLDIPLNDRGLAEVAQTIESLHDKAIDVIYTPISQPSMQTAQAIAKALDIKLKKLDKLQSLNMGLWQGMLVEDVRRKQPRVYRQWQEQPELICPPEGEMLSEADERVHATMAKLLKRHKEGLIALVVPEPLLSLVRRFVTHGELGDLWKAPNGHGRFEILPVVTEEAVTTNL